MRKIATLLPVILLFTVFCNAQTFWTENFESGSTSGELINAYTGPNGTWTLTTSISTPEGDMPNPWYISCAEAGHTSGVCGTGCGSGTLGATLHIGSTTLGDNGASYDAGGFCGFAYCTNTDRRAESPTINCMGKTGITAKFYYIENGDGTNDDGTVYYSADNGTTWTLLVNTPKTTVCSSGQGQWAAYSIALPASANNNPTIKIGFRWVNNDDGIGTDPSYAIDSLSLSTASSGPALPVASFTTTASVACQDSCIIFTSTSTGTVDSLHWLAAGATITDPTSGTTTICFPSAGTFTVTLVAYNSAGTDSSSSITNVTPTPHPVITRSGDTLKVAGTYTSYTWYDGSSVIPGAVSAHYVYPTAGTYYVTVDSAGCAGTSSGYSALGVTNINVANQDYWLSQLDNNSIILHTSALAIDNLYLTVFDATGRTITSDIWQAGNDTKQVNTAFFAPGLYIIKLSNDNTFKIFKWMKK